MLGKFQFSHQIVYELLLYKTLTKQYLTKNV